MAKSRETTVGSTYLRLNESRWCGRLLSFVWHGTIVGLMMNQDFKELLLAFNDEKVEYLIVGDTNELESSES